MATEAAVGAFEKLVERRKRADQAMTDYAVNTSDRARAEARQQAENDRRAGIANSAHERFMQSRRQFIERNPFAVSHFERKALVTDPQAREDQAALREHELNMIDKKNEGAIGVAEKNAEGMTNQGMKAAEINADVKGKEIDAGLKKHELEMQNRKDITTIQADAQKSLAEGQNKTMLENTKLQGENAVKQQSEANKGLLAQSELKEKMEKEKRAAQIQQKMLELEAKSGIALDKENASIVRKALEGKGLSETEEDVFKRLREMYKDNPSILKFIGGAKVKGGSSAAYSY